MYRFSYRVARMFSSSSQYSDKVKEHFQNPRNIGSFNKHDKQVGTGVAGSAACGDIIKFQIKVNDEGKIEDTRIKVFGCCSAVASTSYASEIVKNKTLEDAAQVKNIEIANELALSNIKMHCSILAEDAIKSAIEDYKKKQ
jgi:nitrogen fixation NifU-like protein